MREYAIVYQASDSTYSVIFRDDTDPEDLWFTMSAGLDKSLAELALKGARA
jgi:hypothetical protein